LSNSCRTVIALIPTYNHAPILRSCLKHLERLNPPFDKYVFCENNSTDETLEVIKNFNHPKELIRLWFRKDANKVLGNPYELIGIISQMLLTKARQLNPDYAIIIADDVFVLTESLIDQMISRRKDVVGAPYLRRFPEGLYLGTKWKRKGMKGVWFKQQCMGFQEVYVTSGGCLCLSRKIIQDRRVNFMPIIWNDKEKVADDFGYCKRARNAGYKIYLDCAIKVGHVVDSSNSKPWEIKDGKYVDFEYE